MVEMQEYGDSHIAQWALELTLVAKVEAVAADTLGRFGSKRPSRGLVFFSDAEPCQTVWF